MITHKEHLCHDKCVINRGKNCLGKQTEEDGAPPRSRAAATAALYPIPYFASSHSYEWKSRESNELYLHPRRRRGCVTLSGDPQGRLSQRRLMDWADATEAERAGLAGGCR